MPPHSVLLLPAGGPESGLHFRDSVATPVPAERIAAWLPEQATEILSRVADRVAAWGLRDNTKGLAGSSVQPVIWDRIDVGTLALFSHRDEYFASARVIGKGINAEASAELWGTPEFRWLILLTDVADIALPVDVVRRGAAFADSYILGRQALVPRAHREAGLLAAIAPYLPSAKPDSRETIVREVPAEDLRSETFEVAATAVAREAHRREAALVRALIEWWKRRDGPSAVCRFEIQPEGMRSRLYADLYNRVTNELVEAKGNSGRSDVRMAIGQLADYRRVRARGAPLPCASSRTACKRPRLPARPRRPGTTHSGRRGFSVRLTERVSTLAPTYSHASARMFHAT